MVGGKENGEGGKKSERKTKKALKPFKFLFVLTSSLLRRKSDKRRVVEGTSKKLEIFHKTKHRSTI